MPTNVHPEPDPCESDNLAERTGARAEVPAAWANTLAAAFVEDLRNPAGAAFRRWLLAGVEALLVAAVVLIVILVAHS